MKTKWLHGDRIFNVLLVVLIGVTIWNVQRRLVPRVEDRLLIVNEGDELPLRIINRKTKGVQTISDIARGHCTYVILASASCGACRDAAVAWRRQLARGDVVIPPQWRTYWIVVGDELSADSLFRGEFPVDFYWTEDRRSVVQSLALRAYPAHIVLDRRGTVRASGGGSSLPLTRRLREDCTIAPIAKE